MTSINSVNSRPTIPIGTAPTHRDKSGGIASPQSKQPIQSVDAHQSVFNQLGAVVSLQARNQFDQAQRDTALNLSMRLGKTLVHVKQMLTRNDLNVTGKMARLELAVTDIKQQISKKSSTGNTLIAQDFSLKIDTGRDFKFSTGLFVNPTDKTGSEQLTLFVTGSEPISLSLQGGESIQKVNEKWQNMRDNDAVGAALNSQGELELLMSEKRFKTAQGVVALKATGSWIASGQTHYLPLVQPKSGLLSADWNQAKPSDINALSGFIQEGLNTLKKNVQDLKLLKFNTAQLSDLSPEEAVAKANIVKHSLSDKGSFGTHLSTTSILSASSTPRALDVLV